MQAAFLIAFGTTLRGSPPARFTFRNASPLIRRVPFTLNAEEDGDGLRLWTAHKDGPLAMASAAHWE